jgi:hypothetical protein
MEKIFKGGNQIHNFIPAVSVRTFVISISLRFRFRLFDKLRFRLRTAKSYGSYGYGSGSATLPVGGHPGEVGLLVRQATAGPHNHLAQGRQQGSCNIENLVGGGVGGRVRGGGGEIPFRRPLKRNTFPCPPSPR